MVKDCSSHLLSIKRMKEYDDVLRLSFVDDCCAFPFFWVRIVTKKKDIAQNRLDGYFWHMEKAGSNSLSVSYIPQTDSEFERHIARYPNLFSRTNSIRLFHGIHVWLDYRQPHNDSHAGTPKEGFFLWHLRLHLVQSLGFDFCFLFSFLHLASSGSTRLISFLDHSSPIWAI